MIKARLPPRLKTAPIALYSILLKNESMSPYITTTIIIPLKNPIRYMSQQSWSTEIILSPLSELSSLHRPSLSFSYLLAVLLAPDADYRELGYRYSRIESLFGPHPIY